MIDQLMEERKDAVRYLERQPVGRITRAIKRVWDRGCRIERVATVITRGGRSRSKVTAAAAAQEENRGNAIESDGHGKLSDCVGCFEMY